MKAITTVEQVAALAAASALRSGRQVVTSLRGDLHRQPARCSGCATQHTAMTPMVLGHRHSGLRGTKWLNGF